MSNYYTRKVIRKQLIWEIRHRHLKEQVVGCLTRMGSRVKKTALIPLTK